MAISYDKLFNLLKEKNISVYRLKAEKIIGTATIDKLRKGNGHIDTRSIGNICEYLKCQPGDIMEYVPEDEVNDS